MSVVRLRNETQDISHFKGIMSVFRDNLIAIKHPNFFIICFFTLILSLSASTICQKSSSEGESEE